MFMCFNKYFVIILEIKSYSKFNKLMKKVNFDDLRYFIENVFNSQLKMNENYFDFKSTIEV